MSVSSLRSFEYLEQLPGTDLNKLYQQPSTALAIFRRMLPHLAKTFVMALLFLSAPMPVTDLQAWVRPDCIGERDQSLDVLTRLHILATRQNPSEPRAYHLTNPFAGSLRLALTGGGNHGSFGVPCTEPDEHAVNVDFLDSFARQQWESILYYIVSSTGAGMGGGVDISQSTKHLLAAGNFVVETKRGRPEITQTGFTFLLQEVNAQVWSLLIVYLEACQKLGMKSVEVLSFLFLLGSLDLGQDYSISTLSEGQVKMLEPLSDFGLVYRRNKLSQRFYPTRLATTLTSDASALRNLGTGLDSARSSSGSGTKGFIVVETNYRVYAYTSSPLQINVLGLFTKLSTRYPNMVSGRLSKESVQRAISYGITSDQIISYLTTHAHPQMQKNNPIMPPTVVDQIRLWQMESDRMTATTGFLFKDFGSAAEYEDISRYAETVGVLVWKSDVRRCFFATRHEQLKSYLENKKLKNG